MFNLGNLNLELSIDEFYCLFMIISFSDGNWKNWDFIIF